MKRANFIFFAGLFITACTARPTPLALPTDMLPTPTKAVATIEPLPTSADSIPVSPGDALTPNTDDSYAPQPSDINLERGAAFVERYELLTLESYPLQFMLSLSGNLPDPCHRLRAVINPPDAENKIMIEVYTVADPREICIQVIKPFQLNLPLGSFPGGHYTVWLNGEQIAAFDA